MNIQHILQIAKDYKRIENIVFEQRFLFNRTLKTTTQPYCQTLTVRLSNREKMTIFNGTPDCLEITTDKPSTGNPVRYTPVVQWAARQPDFWVGEMVFRYDEEPSPNTTKHVFINATFNSKKILSATYIETYSSPDGSFSRFKTTIGDNCSFEEELSLPDD